MKTQRLKITYVMCAISIFTLTLCYAAGYRVNTSNSYPPGIYKIGKQPSYHVGELVFFCPPNNDAVHMAKERGYIKLGLCVSHTTPAIKKIFATAGDQIELNDVVKINGLSIPNTTILSHDSQGRPLPALKSFTLSKHQFFMLSDHAPKISYDSRYYGPITDSAVIGKANPIYLF
ncbi:conjugative transfer signal peptidase TraF [Vibrio harveyi]|uniref:conjugative transfer signal peptidase TraF n=1 Tax=Vibrio TaxID=662 RepID=UPI000382B9CF|nr:MULTISPECIES: conjugative transfer signal peptidase TraF [Vibrio]EGR1335247.1 conjugative transfer signal peptidase TraF [Vibrio parahaemolyticus]EJG1127886.1 conjugative transfer signal peptidase TraF [Vibrio parahaemolyticus]EKO3821460.1 conjugative transfer signal peptidase TraF [Vibrio harveyi]GBK99863.1 conjugative transfer signal peptidase TraF [Vibrio harveyi]